MATIPPIAKYIVPLSRYSGSFQQYGDANKYTAIAPMDDPDKIKLDRQLIIPAA